MLSNVCGLIEVDEKLTIRIRLDWPGLKKRCSHDITTITILLSRGAINYYYNY
jgi:hypothetical protein